MKPLIDPTDMVSLSIRYGMMLAEANMVIAMRLWGITGMWNVAPSEHRRMIAEKPTAAMASGAAVSRAMIAGNLPAQVAMAGLQPVRAKTRANVTRLARRGPGAPD